ncbi:MAG: SpoIIE family protein phosphatase [Pontiellaceae bacterium]|nr:SpoIIE family protein phosphatase [Pontiellaceae bacterium]MBN2784594.1 SpoIIE family protein phosphatase [Pontiellaceae bacterium]
MPEIPDESTLMNNLMHQMKDNIFFKDKDGHFILINDEGARRAGYQSPEDMIGKTDLDIFTEEHGREAFNDEQAIVTTGKPLFGKEEKETWEDGHETWVSTTKMPMYNQQGNIIGTFGISRDITKHKQAEMLATHYAEENRRLCDAMGSDMQMAAELQKAFLPATYPIFPDGADSGHLAACFYHHYLSTGTVGGDFCSVRKISPTEAGILLCDVTGHGVRSALITALMRAIVEEISLKEKDPGRFLDHMNAVLHPIIQHDDLFLFSTACYIVLNVQDGTLRYAIAGHPIPILLNMEMDQAEWLTADPSHSGPALAVDGKIRYQTFERQIREGDAVVMYTDGLYEVMNPAGDELGPDRLLELTHEQRTRRINEIFPKLVETIREFSSGSRFEDDVCLVGFRLCHLLTENS